MTQYRALTLSFIAAVAAGLPVPASAQDPVRDFTLPPGETPTPTPTPAQGPVDDTGPVPVAPRPIATDTPTPAPSPTPTVIGAPALQPVPAATPTATPTNSPPQSQPQQQTSEASASPAPAPTANAPSGEPAVIASPATGSPVTPSATPSQQSASETVGAEADEQSAPLWLWIAGALAALLALAAGLFFAMRQRGASSHVPTIERPIVGTSADPAGAKEKGRFALDLEIVSVMRSFMMITVKARVTVANRTDRALRDLEICGDLIGASKTVPIDQQLVRPDMSLASLTTVDRIGPHKSHTAEISVQIPIGEIDGFRQGNIPMIVPLVRLRGDCENAEALAKTFVLGVVAAGGKLQPLSLDGPPGGYQGIGARAIN